MDRQTLDSDALESLASARAGALKTALLEIDKGLAERVIIQENTTVSKENDEPMEMKITLGSKQN